MKSVAEVTRGIDLEAPVHLESYIAGQAAPLIVNGPAATLIDLARKETTRRSVVPSIAAVAVQQPVELTETRPTYKEPSFRQKLAERASDVQWMAFDKRYGTNIVARRRQQRIAKRILVAEIAAGVEDMPVWGKYKKALKEAEATV